MVRRFTQCKSVNERLEFMLSTKKEDWKDNELNTIIEIIGLKVSEEASEEGKWAIILNDLLLKKLAIDKEINENDKIFSDVKERFEGLEEVEDLSDLAGYVELCKKMDPEEAL